MSCVECGVHDNSILRIYTYIYIYSLKLLYKNVYMRIYHSYKYIYFIAYYQKKLLLKKYLVPVKMQANPLGQANLNLVRIFNYVGVMSIFHKIMYKESTKHQPHFSRGWMINLSQCMLIIAKELQSLWSLGADLMQPCCIVHQRYYVNIKG